MPGVELVSDIYDIPKLEGSQERFIALLKESRDAIIDLNKMRLEVKSTDVARLAEATEKLNATIIAANKATGQAVTVGKEKIQVSAAEYKALMAEIEAKKQNTAADKEGTEASKKKTDTDKQGTEAAKQKAAADKETARIAKERAAAEKAEAKAADDASNDYKQLSLAFNDAALKAKNYQIQLGENHPVAIQAVKDANILDEQLKRLDKSVGQSQRNVGNYGDAFGGKFAAAFGVLTKELEGIRQKIAAVGADTSGLKKLEQEEKLLTQLTENLGKAFKSPTQELRAFTNAAKEIGQEFGAASETFNQFAAEVGSKQDELKDIQATINFQASDTKYLDGIVSAVTGLAGAYGVAQSAQALWGEEDEDMQKQMVKLQAVLTLVTSLQTVLNAVQTEGGAVQVGLAVKTQLLNAARIVQNALVGASVASIEAEALATAQEVVAAQAAAAALAEKAAATEAVVIAEGGLVVTTGAADAALLSEAGAAGVATVATSTFATTLIATGIGAIVVAIAAGIAYLVSEIQDWNAANASLIKANKDLTSSLADLVSATKEYEAIRSLSAEKEIRDLESLVEQRKASGVTAGQSLALDKKIAAEKLKTANQTAELYNITNETLKKAQDNARSDADVVRIAEQNKREYIKQTALVKDKDYDFQIEHFDKSIALRKEEAATTKAIFDFANDTYQKQNDTRNQIDLLSTEEAKLNADERRKFILESVRIEADAVTSKNALILSDERSTLDQRLSAIKSNAAQQRAVNQAELKDTLNDPTKSGVDKNLALKKASAESIKITDDTKRAIFDAEETDRKRRLAAEHDLNNTLLQADITLQEQVIANQFGALQDKINAAQKAADDQEKILTDEYNHTRAITVLSNEELIALDAAYNDKLVQLDYATAQKMRAIEEKATADYIALINQRQKAFFDEQNDKSDIATNTTATDIIVDADNQLQKAHGEKRVKLERQFQHELFLIDQQGALDRLKIQAEELDMEMVSAKLIKAEDLYTGIEARITENKRKQAALRKGITDEEYDYEKAKRDKRLDEQLKYETAALDLVQTFGDAEFENEKNKIQAEQELNDKNTQRAIEAVNASTRSEADKAAAIAIIQARAAAQKEQLDARQKKQDYEKAKFDKEIAILTVLAQIAVDFAKGDYAAAALAGIALVKLIATPIPKYKGGRGYGKKELALVHAGEFIHRDGGAIEATPAVESLTHLMPKDKVYKDKATMMRELAMSGLPLSNYHVNQGGSISKKDMEQMTGEIVNAVSEIKIHTTTITKDGWRNHNQRLADYDNWVNKYIRS